MRRIFCGMIAVSVCLAGGVSAEEPGRLTRSYVFTPKSGQSKQFEEAVRKHLQWMKENGEPWSWSGHQVITGDAAGSYVFVTHGHTWSDFNEAGPFRMKAAAHWGETVSQYIESQQSGIFKFVDSHSRMSESPTPTPLASMTTFYLQPFSEYRFLQSFSKVTEIIGQQEAPPSVLTFELVNGGEPCIVFVHPLETWTTMSQIEQAIQEMVKTMGPEAAELAKELRDATVRSETSVLYRRSDLSYEATDAGKSLTAR